ncbi:eCIS core domain-containing protein [Aquimarina sp. 2304DJ70-9]|uniref:eCIS core domain-containing protein n=1 Tax=Aquimarina penaris TaxID=3231044 RepID=UPI003462BB16
MKTAEVKTANSANNHVQAKRQPFFKKEGEGGFFSKSNEVETPFFTSAVQTKLTVGRPNDKYEVEADAMADQVVQKLSQPSVDNLSENIQQNSIQSKSASNSAVQAKCNTCEEEKLQKKEEETQEIIEDTTKEIQTKPIFESETADEVVQTKTDVADTTNTSVSEVVSNTVTSTATPIQTKCDECEKEEVEESTEDQELQKKEVVNASADPSDEEDPNLQLRSKEMEMTEYPILFKKMPNLQLSSGGTATTGSRERIVEEAQKMVGKIEAKKDDGSGRRVGAEHLLEIFHLAAKDEWPDEVIENVRYTKEFPHWCGIFSVYAIKKAGIDLGYWQMGKGVSAFGTLQPTDNPQPGDVGYFTKQQHHCIIKAVNGDMIDSIDGNSGNFSEVKERTRPRSQFHAFFTAFTGSETIIQKKEQDSVTSGSSTNSLQDKLSASAGKGAQMDVKTRDQMESGFGIDFSGVNIHTDSSAVQMNKDLNAQAFTHGNDIYFNKGKYDTNSASGKHLLAHELTHTVQQGASIQKKETPQIQKTETTTASSDEGTPRFIVEDFEIATHGQMKKSPFLRSAKDQIKKSVEEELVGSPYSLDQFPYLTSHFQTLNRSSAEEVENKIKEYTVNTESVTSANQYIVLLSGKLREVTSHWLTTGELPSEPQELIERIPEQYRTLGRVNPYLMPIWRTGQDITQAISTASEQVIDTVVDVGREVGSFFGNVGRGVMGLFTKSGDPSGHDPVSVSQRLGRGAKFSGGSKSQMESVFGRNFSDVEIHTGSKANNLAGELGARAFTVGNQIGFASNQFKPGTPFGDALLAHELAHVQQQQQGRKSTNLKSPNQLSDNQLMETEADQSAVSVVGKLWGRTNEVIGEIGDFINPNAKSGFGIQSCDTEMITDERAMEVRYGDERAEELTESYTVEELVFMLDQLNMYGENYDSRNTAVTTSSCAAASGTPDFHSPNQIIREANTLDEAVSNDPETFQNALNFEELEILFLVKFKERAKEETLQLLTLNESIVQGEKDRYLVPSNQGGMQSLYDALAPLRAIGQRIETQNEIIDREADYDPKFGFRDSHPSDAIIEELIEEVKQELISLGGEYPILLDKDLLEGTHDTMQGYPAVGPGYKILSTFSKLIYGDQDDLREIVTEVSDARLEDIQETRDGLNDDPSRVYNLPEIIQGTKIRLGIQENSLADKIVEKKRSDIRLETIFRNLAVAGLGITLGLFTGGTGTVAVLATMGSITLSGLQLMESIDNYIFESAASGTAFDRAQAISQNTPSPLWLALDIIGLVGDLAAGLRIARALGESAQAARTAEDTAEAMAQLSNDAGRVGRELAGEGLVRSADEVQEMAEASVRRQLAQDQALGDAANVDALRAIDAVVDNLTEAERFGLLQLPEVLRTRVLSNLSSDVIRSIAGASSRSQSFRGAMQVLQDGLSNNQAFTSILESFMRSGSGEGFLRTMREVGISADDLRRIDFSRVTTSQGYYNKFRNQVYDLLGNRVTSDLDNISDVTNLIGGLHSSQQRAIITRLLNRLQESGELPAGLVSQITASADLRRILASHSFDTRQMLTWWNDFNRTNPGGAFADYVEPLSGIRFRGRPNPRLSDFFSSLGSNATDLEKNLSLLNVTEPRLAEAIRTGTGLPQHLAQRLQSILNNPGVRGAATTLNGGASKVRQAMRAELAQHIAGPSELQQVMQLINEPGLRGSLGEAYFAAKLAGSGTRASDLAHVPFSPSDIPGLTRNPFRPDRFRPGARRSLDIKTGYEGTPIDVDQMANYNRLFEQSQVAGSTVQQRLNALFGTPTGGGLRGHDYLFLPGPGGNARRAAEEALDLIRSTMGQARSRFAVYFQDADGIIYQLSRRIDASTGDEVFATRRIGGRLPD